MNLFPFRRAAVPVLSFLLPAGMLRAEVLQLDFLDDDDATSVLQDGWTGISGPSWQAAANGISVVVAPLGTVTLDDRTRATNGGGAEPDMWRDFLFANGSNAAGDGLRLTFSGLQPSTVYPITLWGFDKSTTGGNHITDWSANDGPEGAFAQKGKLSFNGALAAPQSLSEYQVTFNFKTDATGDAILQGLWAPETVAGHTVFLNGLRIGDAGVPTNIALAPPVGGVASGAPLNTLAGTLSSTSTQANDTFTFSLAAGEGDFDNHLFTLSGPGNSEIRVNSSLLSYGGSTASLRVKVTNSLNASIEAFFVIPVRDDSDNDALLDAWEFQYFPDDGLTTTPETDPDGDNSPNLNEQAKGTDPTVPDSDGDGLNDGAESGTGVFVAATDTGTNPLAADTDRDGFPDNVENPLLPPVGLEQPGTDPVKFDSDGDGYGDKYETVNGSNAIDIAAIPVPAGLLIDFSHGADVTGGQVAGPQLMAGYQSFTADHEINGSVDRAQSYTAFGAQVSLTVAFPDSSAATVKQLINRPDANNNVYVGEKRNLMRDWIGIDGRTASGGNGPDVFTSMTFTLEGLPAGTYQYRSYQHDTELQHPDFEVEIADAGPAPRVLGPFTMTASTLQATNNPSPVNPGIAEGPETLPSTVTTALTSNGASPVVVTYRYKPGTAGATVVFGVNGFDLTATAVSEPLIFTSVTRNPVTGAVTLNWTGGGAALCTVQKTESLATGPWSSVGTSSTGSFTDTPPANTPVRFYRVVRP